MSYDTGDKSVQCGRKVDAFKLWFMLKVCFSLKIRFLFLSFHLRHFTSKHFFSFFSFKARGEDYMEDIVDNTFAMTDYLEELVNS